LLRGGNADSRLIPATLLDRVTPQLRIPDAKTFGPVNCLVRVKNTEEAVACANVNEYGLPAAVFWRDIASAFTVARKIDLGICHATGPTMHAEAQMSFGGVKGSGIGRFGGKGEVAEFTELRWITIRTQPRRHPS